MENYAESQSKLEIRPVETCLVLTPRKSLTSFSGRATLAHQPGFLSPATGAAVGSSLEKGMVCSLQDGPNGPHLLDYALI